MEEPEDDVASVADSESSTATQTIRRKKSKKQKKQKKQKKPLKVRMLDCADNIRAGPPTRHRVWPGTDLVIPVVSSRVKTEGERFPVRNETHAAADNAAFGLKGERYVWGPDHYVLRKMHLNKSEHWQGHPYGLDETDRQFRGKRVKRRKALSKLTPVRVLPPLPGRSGAGAREERAPASLFRRMSQQFARKLSVVLGVARPNSEARAQAARQRAERLAGPRPKVHTCKVRNAVAELLELCPGGQTAVAAALPAPSRPGSAGRVVVCPIFKLLPLVRCSRPHMHFEDSGAAQLPVRRDAPGVLSRIEQSIFFRWGKIDVTRLAVFPEAKLMSPLEPYAIDVDLRSKKHTTHVVLAVCVHEQIFRDEGGGGGAGVAGEKLSDLLYVQRLYVHEVPENKPGVWVGLYRVMGVRFTVKPPTRMDRRNVVLHVQRSESGKRYQRMNQEAVDKGVAKGSLRRELNLCLYVEAVGTNVRTVMPLDSEGWL